MTISNKTRNKKSEVLNEQDSLKRWVKETAEATGRTEEEVVALALYRLERERLQKEK